MDVKNILYQGGKDMLSINLKKKVAVLLTGAMVLGMTVTAAAADPIEVTGSGSSEGHVNMTVMDVTLPTAADNADTFKYIVDAEGLVKATAHARYGEDVSFPAVGSDTSVYFQTDTKKYENESKHLTVSNNSSVSINLTVKVEVTSADTDVDLVSENALGKAKTPSLYLGLKVGDKEPAAVTKDEGATVSISLNKAGGYSVSWNSTKSEYEYIRGEGAPAAPTYDFWLEGATNPELGSAEGKTAPALKVTWKYDAAGGDTPAPAQGPKVTATAAGLVTVSNLTVDETPQGVTLSADGKQTISIGDRPGTYTLTNKIATDGTFLCQLGNEWLEYYAGKTTTVTVPLKNGKSITTTVTFPAN
jgi:hypothetical protein